MEYGLPPPRRIKQRRDRKLAKKQVHTMATAEKAASGSDWHLPLRKADGEDGSKETAECILCKKAHEESGGSWKGELPKETIAKMATPLVG